MDIISPRFSSGLAPRASRLPLHRRPKHPRRELVVAVAEDLALGGLAGRGLEDQFEELLAHVLNAGLAVHNDTAVDVHVLFLAVPQRRVGSKLQRRRRLAAIGGS